MQLTTHPNEWVQYTSQPQHVVQSQRNQDGARISIIPNQPQEISSPESMNSQRKDVTKSIQPRFMYQSTSLDYYELMEDWEVEENTNIDVFEEIEENYLQSFEYAEAQVNMLDEVPQSYSRQGNPKQDQINTQLKHEIMNLWIQR